MKANYYSEVQRPLPNTLGATAARWRRDAASPQHVPERSRLVAHHRRIWQQSHQQFLQYRDRNFRRATLQTFTMSQHSRGRLQCHRRCRDPRPHQRECSRDGLCHRLHLFCRRHHPAADRERSRLDFQRLLRKFRRMRGPHRSTRRHLRFCRYHRGSNTGLSDVVVTDSPPKPLDLRKLRSIAGRMRSSGYARADAFVFRPRAASRRKHAEARQTAGATKPRRSKKSRRNWWAARPCISGHWLRPRFKMRVGDAAKQPPGCRLEGA